MLKAIWVVDLVWLCRVLVEMKLGVLERVSL
jgi:hypothetical protein